MKNSLKIILVLCLSFFAANINAQVDYNTSTIFDSTSVYVVIKNDGTEFIGHIIENTPHEILIATISRGNIYIPQHEIQQIRLIENPGDIKSGEYVGEEMFATRYFLTTNALMGKKGESYGLINIYGPEVHYSVSDRLSLGLMTSWAAIPVIGAAKYSIYSKNDFHFGVGLLAGTGSWAAFDAGGALPFASVTIGNKVRNLNLSGGYGMISLDGNSDGLTLFSVSGLAKIGKNTSLVLDSFIGSQSDNTFALIIPGVRFQKKMDRAFQFGFAGVVYTFDDYQTEIDPQTGMYTIVYKGKKTETLPIPVPFVSWFIKF